MIDKFAQFLLDIGWGIDFSTSPYMPPKEVLENMVLLMANDPFYVDGETEKERLEAAHWLLAEEIGEWR